jgi:hypothetical protein
METRAGGGGLVPDPLEFPPLHPAKDKRMEDPRTAKIAPHRDRFIGQSPYTGKLGRHDTFEIRSFQVGNMVGKHGNRRWSAPQNWTEYGDRRDVPTLDSFTLDADLNRPRFRRRVSRFGDWSPHYDVG